MEIQVTPLLQESIILLGAKRTMLRREQDGIDTLVLGSSHGDFGFNPLFHQNSFNLCSRSQDLKHSFHLQQEICEKNPAIKNIVLYYSIFSSGFVLERSSEDEISPALNELFHLGIEYESDKLKLLSENIRGKLGNLSVEMEGVRGFLPKEGKSFFLASYGAQKRAEDHLKFNRRSEANSYLVQILLLARKLRQRVCIVLPPARSDYKAATGGDSKVLFRSLFETLNDFSRDCDIDVVNGFDSELFPDTHFGDYDHLLPLGEGTEVLTRLVLATSGYCGPRGVW